MALSLHPHNLLLVRLLLYDLMLVLVLLMLDCLLAYHSRSIYLVELGAEGGFDIELIGGWPYSNSADQFGCANAFVASKHVLTRFRPLNVGRKSDIDQ